MSRHRQVAILVASTLWALVACGKMHNGSSSCASKSKTGLRLNSAMPVYPYPSSGRPAPIIATSLSSYGSCQELKDETSKAATDYGTSTQQYTDYYVPSSGSSQTYIPGSYSQNYVASESRSSARSDDGDCVVAAADKANNDPSGAAESASTSTTTTSGAVAADMAPSSASGTNVQVAGVDEADTYKIGDHHIYALQGQRARVVDRESLKFLGDLPLTDVTNAKLFTDGDRLVLYGSSSTATVVKVYDAPAGALPTLIKSQTFSGVPLDARLVNGRLILVAQDVFYVNPTFEADPRQFWQADTAGGVSCTAFIRPVVTDGDLRFVKVASLNTRTPDEAIKWAAVPGGADLMYMTKTELYLGKQISRYGVWDTSPVEQDRFALTRVDLNADTGDLSVSAFGVVDGRVKDQWAINAYEDQGVVSLATTTGEIYPGSSDPATNHLWILKADGARLNVAAKVDDFGAGEDIRSVRYVGNTAYVVTFKKTDPLFGFDLSDALHPKALGELKMPGFSMYMHPVAPGRMLGVGFDAADQGDFAWFQGIQISLFDVADPTNFQRLDNIVIGSRGSASDVTGDHHAFFYDSDSKMAAVPIVEVKGGQPGTSQLGTELGFSGALFYNVGDKLNEVARISHKDMMTPSCQAQIGGTYWWENKTVSLDINRIFQVDGRLVTLSRFGIKALAIDDPATVMSTTVFPGSDSCPSNGDVYMP